MGNDDVFAVTLNGYNDKQQSLEFMVMPTGIKYDAKVTNDYGEDSLWNAVWNSAVQVDNDAKRWLNKLLNCHYHVSNL